MNKAINKNRIIYLIASIGGHVYIFFTIPLLTHYLSKDNFGLYMILTQIVVVIQASLLVLFANGLLKFWVDTKDNEKKTFMGTIFISYLIIAMLVTFLLYLYQNEFFKIFFPNVKQNINNVFIYTLLWLFFISLRSFLLTFVKILEKPKFVLIHIITYGVLLVILLYYNLVYKHGQIAEVMQSFFIAELCALTILILPTYSNFDFKFKFAYLKPFIKFSLPLIGGSFAFIAFQNIDRVILARYVNLEDMGVYGIGFMFGSIAGMIVTANMSAYLPRVKKVMSSGNKNEVKKLTTHYMQEIQHLMLIVVFGIAVFGDLIVYLFANKYSGSLASVVMVGIAIGHLVRSNYLFFEQILFLNDKVREIFVIKILILIIGVIIGFLFIKLYGLIGASLIWSIIFIIINIVAYQFIKKYSLVEINWFKNLILIIIVYSLFFANLVNSFYLGLKIIESLLLIFLIIFYYKLYIKRK